MENIDIENVILDFVKLRNAFEQFNHLSRLDESFELDLKTLPDIYTALDAKKRRSIELILAKFTQMTHTEFTQGSKQGNFEQYWLEAYDLFILDQVERVIMKDDYYLSRVELLVWLISSKSPNNLYDVYIKFISRLTRLYREKSNYKVLYILYFLEQLMEYIWGFEKIDDERLILGLTEICYLKIEDEDKPEVTFGYLKKTLSVLASIGTKECVDVIKDFRNHGNAGVSNKAQKLYDKSYL